MGLLDDIGAGLAAAQTPGLVDDNGNPTISGDLTAQNTPGLTDSGQGAAGVQGLPGSPSGPAVQPPQPSWLDNALSNIAATAVPQAAAQPPQTPPPQAPQTAQPPPVTAPVDNRPSETQSAAGGLQAARLAMAQQLSQGSKPASVTQAPAQATGPVAPAQQTAMPSDDEAAPYASIRTPPSALTPLIAQASQKYGVPPQLLTWSLGQESGFTNAKPNAYGATGIAQFKPTTAQQYGIDPTNIPQSIDGAAHYLSDLYKKYGSWEQAVGHYGTFSTGVGKDAAVQAGFRTAMKGAGVDVGAPYQLPGGGSAPTSAPNSAPPGTQLVTNGNTTQGQGNGKPPLYDPLAFMSDPRFAQLAARMRPTSSQQLMALASGLLGARTWGQGLGQGLANMNQMQLQGRQMEGELAKIGLSSAQIAAMMGYRNTRLGQMQTTLDMGKPVGQPIQLQDGSMAQPYNTPNGTIYKPLPGVTTQQQRVTNQVSGGNAFGGTMGKEAGGDYKELMEGAQTDALSRENIVGAVGQLKQNPGVYGPGLLPRVQRSLAMFGLGDPGQLQAYQKMTADQQAKYLENATGGHIASLRSLGSLKMFSQAVAHADTDPSAAQYVFDSQLAMINARDKLRAAVNQDPSAWQGPQFSTKEQQFYTNYFKTNPLPIYRPGYTSQLVGGSTQPQGGGGSPAMDAANASTTHTVTLGGQNYQVTYNPPSQ